MQAPSSNTSWELRVKCLEMQENRWHWWQTGVIYQIYPLSFCDSDGDGAGDIPGVLSRLDYLKWLGVDAVWFSPIFPSPMADWGYDVSHYTDIAPVFGNLEAFDVLLREAHQRGLKVLLDLVPNHTSSQHPWFLESRQSRNSAKRSWYIWKDASEQGGAPNNWLSIFGGSAWEWDEITGQYYYHAFLKEQPDLNWRNPEVHAAMHLVLKFWLNRGVDGFRIDVIWHLIKDSLFRDNPVNPRYTPDQSPYLSLLATYTADRPEVHDVIAGIRRLVEEYEERVLLGEIYLPVERLVEYYGAGGTGLHLPFNFQLIQLPWRADDIRHAVQGYERLLPAYGWPNWVLGNHDRSRVASRIGSAQARVAALLLLTLRGTPIIYYGEEIGMLDTPVPPEKVRDTRERRQPGRGRDPVRTPMQWNSDREAGFTAGTPWLPVNPNYHELNVEKQRSDPKSMLSLYRKMLQLRRSHPALQFGSYEEFPAPPGVVAFLRRAESEALLVALNLTSVTQTVPIHGVGGRIVLNTWLDEEVNFFQTSLTRRADEGVILQCMD
jgi:alpha-glucosidase